MTLSEPSRGPTLLGAVLHTDHARLLALIGEASVATSTPGVRDTLAQQVVAAVSAHTNAEAQVVYPAARDLLGPDTADRLTDTGDGLQRLLEQPHRAGDGRDAWLGELRAALESHCRAIDDDVLPAMADRAPELMATLGYRFGAVLESASPRPTA
jgi:hypothetical protein